MCFSYRCKTYSTIFPKICRSFLYVKYRTRSQIIYARISRFYRNEFDGSKALSRKTFKAVIFQKKMSKNVLDGREALIYSVQ